MPRKLVMVVGVVLLAVAPALAWNRAGHMAMGAIAYDDVQRVAPGTAARVVAILRRHPQYESRWKPQLTGMSEQDQERFLFMLAARWPDDIRGDKAFDHPLWHYIDYPYKPPDQPASVSVLPPERENLVEAFERNVAIVRTVSSDPEKDDQTAVALCWIFHLMGDAHQPLHATMLFTTQFPMGDRGGNLFYIKATAVSAETQNLHAYWDNILLTDDRYDSARDRAVALAAAYPRRSLNELADPHFERWVKKESFDLAVSAVYRKGKLQAGADRDHGSPLPGDYEAAAKRVAERRVTLSAYRLADFLRNTVR